MLRSLSFGLLLLAPVALSAQQGTIAYSHTVKIDFEIPPEMQARIQARGGDRAGGGRGARGAGRAGGGFPTERTSDVVLFFDESQSLMKPVPRARPEGARGGGAGEGGRRLRVARLGAVAANRGAQDVLVEAHVRYDEGQIVEARTLLGRPFLIADEQPSFAWKLSGEQAEYLGYVVQKATAERNGSEIEAWFTPQIPVAGGPGIYGGLPGMILVVSVDEGQTQYNATQVSLAPIEEGVIVVPSEGESMSREAYDELVEEKLDELRRTRGGDR